ncbi:hypothetical protein Tco_0422782 [Tanacetum coccineum]
MSADSSITYSSRLTMSTILEYSILRSLTKRALATVVRAGHHVLQRVYTCTYGAGGSFTSIRPLSPRALEVEMRDVASAYYHSLHPSGTPPLLPIPLPAPSTSRRADIPEADTPPRKRLLLTTPRPGRVTYQVDVCTRESSEFCTRHHDAQKDRAAVRAEIEVLRRERLAYEQEGMETRQALARSEAHCRALEARVTVLETEARRHEWQRQAADDLAVQHIMRTQALEAGARVDTLEDTGSSS